MGYHRAGFEVTGVDIAPQPRFPFAFIQADALEYLAAHGHEYDAIHASPPCQKWTMLNRLNVHRGFHNRHIDLIATTRAALKIIGKTYIIENVQGAALLTGMILCGRALGLPRLSRHRHFESNIMLLAPRCACRKSGTIIGVYGERPDGRRIGRHPKAMAGISRVASSIDEASEAMGIDWMAWPELTQAIPPAYTEYIGRQLMAALQAEVPA